MGDCVVSGGWLGGLEWSVVVGSGRWWSVMVGSGREWSEMVVVGNGRKRLG